MEELQAIQKHYNKIKAVDYETFADLIESIKPDIFYLSQKEKDDKRLKFLVSKFNDKNFADYFIGFYVSDTISIFNKYADEDIDIEKGTTELTYNEIISKNIYNAIFDENSLIKKKYKTKPPKENEDFNFDDFANFIRQNILDIQVNKKYMLVDNPSTFFDKADHTKDDEKIANLTDEEKDEQALLFRDIRAEALNILSTEMFYKYIESDDILKSIFSLQKYKEELDPDKKHGITFTISPQDRQAYTIKFIPNPQTYKKYYFDFLLLNKEQQDKFFNFNFCFLTRFFLLDNFLFFYNEETPPEYFTATTKKFLIDFIKTEIPQNDYNQKDFFVLFFFNYLQEFNDIKAFFDLFIDLHNYTIKKAIHKTLETAEKQNKDDYNLHLTDKAYKNIESTITNFNTLNNPKAIKDTQTFSGYLKSIAKNKKDYFKLQKDFYELKQTNPEITRREALDILAPTRAVRIDEYLDFENIDYTTKTIFDDFDIDTNTNIITSKANSMELSINFDNALILTKDNRETKEFLRFIISKYIEDRKKDFIEFTIFEYDTHKGITNHTKEARTKTTLDNIIIALDFARIKQQAKLVENGETHILTDTLHILSREQTDTNIDEKTKTYKIYLDQYFKNFIDDILDSKINGKHITYINKKITDLTKTIGNNGQRQKAQTIGEYLTELKRFRENKPQYKKDFKNGYFIYTCKINDIINLLLDKKQINPNYKKSFKRLCVELLQNVFYILEDEEIAIIRTEAFEKYADKNIYYDTGRTIAQKQNNFLQCNITFYLMGIYKALTYKQVISKQNYYKHKK